MSDYVTKDQCASETAKILEKLDGIEKRLFKDNGTLSIQTRLDRHEMVIRAVLWVSSIVAGTALAGIVTACFVLAKVLTKMGGV